MDAPMPGRPGLILDRVAVHGSRYRHYTKPGEQLTLCCRVAERRTLARLPNDPCNRCTREAIDLPDNSE